MKSLGNSVEEKWLNIQRIKSTKKKWIKYTAIFYIGASILGIFVNVQFVGMGKISSILLWFLLCFMTWLFTGYIQGIGIAWGLYELEGKTDYFEIDDKKVSTDDIIRAYFIGGEDYAMSVAIGDTIGSVISWIIMIFVGFYLGWINAIIRIPECIKVKKEIKEKYKNSKNINL